MCGIVGAIARKNITNILIENLKRLEYRGYDSAGIAIIDAKGKLERLRSVGKIEILEKELKKKPLVGNIGIAQTRWATHGAPSKKNAHPHISKGTIALVHNGIIENHEELRSRLQKSGYAFTSDTDTEVIVHLIHKYYGEDKNLVNAVFKASKQLTGVFALAVLSKYNPESLVVVRYGSPLVIGLGERENHIASDSIALLPRTNKFIYLEEGDLAEIKLDSYQIYDKNFKKVTRPIKTSELSFKAALIGDYDHYMQKEIFEQPIAIAETINSVLDYKKQIPEDCFGKHAIKKFSKIKCLQITACGSSYNAACIAKNWLESIAGISCKVEIASELRYREAVVEPNTLFVAISQSGETADTLAALRAAKKLPYLATLAICNVPESTLARESDLVFLTRAGVEIGVATTKALTTALAALFILTLTLGKYNKLKTARSKQLQLLEQLKHTSVLAKQVLYLDDKIKILAKRLCDKEHVFFLGRGCSYPVAVEGALKFKEISYIHAESYPAGELKHGPLALIDKNTPVVAIAPNDGLTEKLKSNIYEVTARGGEVIVFADEKVSIPRGKNIHVQKIPEMPKEIAPIIYLIPLQLLAYHVAVLKKNDVDKPRNLAKSVTVE
jgi:glucosamine--fructose-6-phosphate aminotransferase (isomerizing)